MTDLGCARCGDCCDPVTLNPGNAQLLFAGGEVHEDPESQHPTQAFALAHWTVVGARHDGQVLVECDAYDRTHHACAAHDTRPPVCSRYPWYDGQRTAGRPHEETAAALLPRCSYLLGVAPEHRPSNARPLIPITALHHAAGVSS